MKFGLFMAAAVASLFAQATDAIEPIVSASYAYKDLTISGLLLAAVAYLYRENRGLRAETKAFIEAQTEVQTVALGKVVSSLSALEASSREQVTVYRQHIDRLVDLATKK